MESPAPPPTKKHERNFLEFNHLKRWWNVIVITIGTISVFALAGYALDSWLETRPWMLVTAVLISFPVTQILLIRKMKKFAEEETKSKLHK